MTARDTIADVMRETYWDAKTHDWSQMADAVMAGIRGMAPDELAELRPDIATEFYILREQVAMRGQYLLTTLRAHHAHQAEEGQP